MSWGILNGIPDIKGHRTRIVSWKRSYYLIHSLHLRDGRNLGLAELSVGYKSTNEKGKHLKAILIWNPHVVFFFF